jgi:hypothetical protein
VPRGRSLLKSQKKGKQGFGSCFSVIRKVSLSQQREQPGVRSEEQEAFDDSVKQVKLAAEPLCSTRNKEDSETEKQ